MCVALESAVDDELFGAIALPPSLEVGPIAVAFTGPLLKDESACLLPPEWRFVLEPEVAADEADALAA